MMTTSVSWYDAPLKKPLSVLNSRALSFLRYVEGMWIGEGFVVVYVPVAIAFPLTLMMSVPLNSLMVNPMYASSVVSGLESLNV